MAYQHNHSGICEQILKTSFNTCHTPNTKMKETRAEGVRQIPLEGIYFIAPQKGWYR